MSERYNQVPLPAFVQTETREILGHTVTVYKRDLAPVAALEEKVAKTPLTDEMMRRHLEGFIAYLKLPLIVDDFGDGEEKHFARTEWRNAMIAAGDRVSYDFIDTGMLKGNNMVSVLSRYEFMQKAIADLDLYKVSNPQDAKDFTEIIDSGIVLIKQMIELRDRGSVVERILFVKRITAHTELVIKGLLKIFGKETA